MKRSRRFSALRIPQPTAVEVCADFEPYRLIQARQMNGWTRRDLADATGLEPWRIAYWETGVLTPKPYELEKIAETTETIVPFFKRGRPMVVLDSSHLFMCTVDR